MMKTNKDKMLQKVLQDKVLMEYYDYVPEDYPDISTALASSNAVVAAVAMIIDSLDDNEQVTRKNLYSKVFNFLNDNLS